VTRSGGCRIFLAGGRRIAIQRFELREGQLGFDRHAATFDLAQERSGFPDDHGDGQAPVAEMVLADHLFTAGFEHA